MSEQYLMMNEAQNEPDVEAASALRRETFSVERPQSEPGTVSTKKTPTKVIQDSMRHQPVVA